MRCIDALAKGKLLARSLRTSVAPPAREACAGVLRAMLVAGATTTYKVIEVGHTGAKAAWGDVKIVAGADAWEGSEGGENEG